MKKYIILSFILLVLYLLFTTLYHAGVFNTIKNKSEFENLKVYEGIYGPEDLEIDSKGSSLFISSSDRWKLNSGIQSDDGIYLLDLTKDSIPYKLATTFTGEFHPHGISYLYYENDDYLFVINHLKNDHSIELFNFRNDTIFHIQSFKDELLNSPNDIVAIDIDNFYITIDHGSKEGFMRVMEDYIRLPLSYLVYYNGDEFSKVYDGLHYANGINISPDGNILYITETTSGELSALKRNKETGELDLLFTKKLNTGLDNITIDANGDLWIAAHPKLLDFVAHSKDASKISPSQILRLHPIANSDFEVEEIYLDDGKILSGTSTALFHNDQVFIGHVFDDKVVRANFIQ